MSRDEKKSSTCLSVYDIIVSSGAGKVDGVVVDDCLAHLLIQGIASTKGDSLDIRHGGVVV